VNIMLLYYVHVHIIQYGNIAVILFLNGSCLAMFFTYCCLLGCTAAKCGSGVSLFQRML